MKKLNRESASPLPIRRSASAPYFHLLFKIFHSPPRPGEVIKNGEGDPNYVAVYFPFSSLFIGDGRV